MRSGGENPTNHNFNVVDFSSIGSPAWEGGEEDVPHQHPPTVTVTVYSDISSDSFTSEEMGKASTPSGATNHPHQDLNLPEAGPSTRLDSPPASRTNLPPTPKNGENVITICGKTQTWVNSKKEPEFEAEEPGPSSAPADGLTLPRDPQPDGPAPGIDQMMEEVEQPVVGNQSLLNAANVSSQSSELRELVQRLPPPYGLSSGPRGPPINLAYDEEVVEEEPEIILEVLQSDSDSHTRRLWRRRRRSPSPTYHNRKMKR